MDDKAQDNGGSKPRWSAGSFFVLLALAALFPVLLMLKLLSGVEMDWFLAMISALVAPILVMDFRKGTATLPRTSMDFRRSDEPVRFWLLTMFNWIMVVFLFVGAVGGLQGRWKF